MTSPWSLYQRHPAFVLGFHGTERKLVSKLVSQRTKRTRHLKKSDGIHEWIGHGIYFWENDPQRGLEWAQDGNAKHKIKEPDVVGAIIDLGHCLDLTMRTGLDEVARAFEMLNAAYQVANVPLPTNQGGPDKLKRELDCEVIQALHFFRKQENLPPYDSVRAPFPEDRHLFDGAGFRLRNHIQIAVINEDCIKGYFRPLKASD